MNQSEMINTCPSFLVIALIGSILIEAIGRHGTMVTKTAVANPIKSGHPCLSEGSYSRTYCVNTSNG
jgi:hypothetical protein